MSNAASPDKPKKAKRAPMPPRPFYLVYTISDAGEIVKHEFTRKTDDILNALDAVEGARTLKLEAPKRG